MVLAPILGFLSLSAFLLVRALSKPRNDFSWGRLFLEASLIWACFLTLLTELLSALGILRLEALLGAWSLVILGASARTFHIWRIEAIQSTALKVQVRSAFEKYKDARVEAVLVGTALLLTLLVALAAPPNTWDSMTYHMSRVEHWIANQSVRHYPTSISRQIIFPPWAEFAILHFQILSHGRDFFANLIQWSALLGSIIAVGSIVRNMGGSPREQVVAGLLVVAAPMSILQATSTQNDLATGYFLLCGIYFAGELLASYSRRRSAYFALSIALAFFTKGTAYIYAVPIVLFLGLSLAFRKRTLELFSLGITALGALLIINGPHWYRNFRQFNHPFGDREFIAEHQNSRNGLQIAASNSLKNAAMHLGTPFPQINQNIENALRQLHSVIGISVDDPSSSYSSEFKIPKMSNHEDEAGNAIVSGLALISFLLALGRKMPKRRQVLGFFILILMSWILFAGLIRWQPWISRLHTPVFLALSVPIALSLCSYPKWVRLTAVLLFCSTLPWLFANRLRPLISLPSKGMTSVFFETRENQYFVNRPVLTAKFRSILNEISKLPCAKGTSGAKVGMVIGPDTWEYPIWQMSKSRGLSFQFRHLLPASSYDSAQGLCAVIVAEVGPQTLLRISVLKHKGPIWTDGEWRLYQL